VVVLNRNVRTFLFIVAAAAITAGVIAERISTTELHAQLAAQRDHRTDVDRLRREQERLRAQKQSADERARLAAEAAEAAAAASRAQPDRLTVGKWLPPGAWKNRGCATAVCTLESMLWAAAGGEAAALGDMLHFDDNARAKIDELFARLPADYRARYVSPVQLVAAFTTEAIPIGNAKLGFLVQQGPDEAEANVFITMPDYRPLDSANAAQRSSFDDLVGPTWRRGQKNTASLSLRRIDGAWRLLVPISAVARIEKEIGGLK
jgi:hypothetical protein